MPTKTQVQRETVERLRIALGITSRYLRATDAGEPGRARDVFAITIRSATGAVVASVDATLTSGNIQSQ